MENEKYKSASDLAQGALSGEEARCFLFYLPFSLAFIELVFGYEMGLLEPTVVI